MKPIDYGFLESMVFSEGQGIKAGVERILLDNIPGAISVEKATPGEDKKGTDYWVHRQLPAPRLSIDLKSRRTDPVAKYNADDLALEIWSVKHMGKIGWTLDITKTSDYILWLFEPTDRWVMVPFPMLCLVFQEHFREWASKYKHASQTTNQGEWESECLFVPRKVIWRAIYDRFGGNPSP